MKIKSLTIILIVFFINSDERLVVMGADEPVYAHAGEDVTLNCSVDTQVNVKGLRVEWKKTDEGDIMVLRYAGGENRPESQHEKYSGRAEFFSEEIPKGNFSMKLRKVRFEDKGEFRCEVHSYTDSNSTTARIAAVGYSSWHWGILVLCFGFIPGVIFYAALLARNCIKKRKCGYPPLPHWSLVILPPIMVSSAFILWSVTEGSTEETVICTVISFLSFLVLFIMDPSCFFSGLSIRRKNLIQSTGVTIIILIICSFPVIEFLITYSTTAPGKAALGVFVGGLVVVLVFVVSLQISFFWIWEMLYNYFWTTLQKRLRRAICAITILLIIMVSVTIGLGVFVGKYFSDRPDIAAFSIFQLIMLIIPYVGLEIFLIFFFTADKTRQHILLHKYHDLFSSLIWWYNIVAFTFYVNFVSWVEDNFFLGYFICITVISLGLSLCFIATIFLYSFKYFYVARKILVGFLFLLHLILNIWYLSVILENDKGRPVRICELVFIYFLTATNNHDWYQNSRLAKPRKYVYFFGVYAVLLVNSVALAVALKLKADTGKQPFDLRLIVLISGSVFLFIWIAMQMFAYWLDTITKIKEESPLVERHQDPKPDQPKITEEQLKSLNEVCEYQHQARKKILNHIFHCKVGMSCKEANCSWSDGLNKNCNGATAIKEESPLVERHQDPKPDQLSGPLTDAEKPKMTEEQLKSLNEVYDRQDLTMDKIMKHMFHRKAGLYCQDVKCPLLAMCSSGPTANDKVPEPDQCHHGSSMNYRVKNKIERSSSTPIRTGMLRIRKAFFSWPRPQDSNQLSGPLTDPEKPKMTEEQLKSLNEGCDRQDPTMDMIVVHKAGMSCQESSPPDDPKVPKTVEVFSGEDNTAV